MIPDELFDAQLADLSGAEVKVLLYIMRRTFGFKKASDAISLNQICSGIQTKDGRVLDRGTGLSQSTVVLALKGLTEANIVIAERRDSAERGHQATSFRLNVVDPLHRKSEKPPSTTIGEALHRKTETQNTVIQETDISTSKYSKREISTSNPKQAVASHSASRMASVGAVLARRAAPIRQGSTHLDRRLVQLTTEWSTEWGDTRHLRSNLTQVRHLQDQSGLSTNALVSILYEGHAITKQHGVTSTRRMAYFFAVVRDLLRLRQPPAN